MRYISQDSIEYWEPRGECESVTIRLPKKTLQELREQADRSKCSVSALIAKALADSSTMLDEPFPDYGKSAVVQ